jgi:hypothetical protein
MPLMEQLHWLQVRERIEFKLCAFAYRCRIDTAQDCPQLGS